MSTVRTALTFIMADLADRAAVAQRAGNVEASLAYVDAAWVVRECIYAIDGVPCPHRPDGVDMWLSTLRDIATMNRPVEDPS